MTIQPANTGGTRRFKSMMRHTRLVTVTALLLCAGVGAVAFYYVSQPTTLRFATSPSNPEDTRVVHAITAQLGRERASVRLRTVVKDGGPGTAAAAIDSGEADLAIVRRDTGIPRDGQVVAILRKNVAVFIVAAQVPDPAQATAPASANPTAARDATTTSAVAPVKTEPKRKPEVEESRIWSASGWA